MGERGMEGGGGIICLLIRCHNQNDSGIRMDREEGHFNVPLSVRDKVKGQCPQTTIFLRESRAEADWNRGHSANQPKARPDITAEVDWA